MSDMTREEAKEIFLNRGFVNGFFDGDKWRQSIVVISKWLEQELKTENIGDFEGMTYREVIFAIFPNASVHELGGGLQIFVHEDVGGLDSPYKGESAR